MSLAENRTLPCCTVFNPSKVVSNVVLPTPFRPRSASASPLPNCLPTSSRMTVSPWPRCNTRTSSSASVMAALAQINVSNVWIRANVADTAFHQDAAFNKDCDALGEAKYQVHVMLDHEHCDILGQSFEQLK